MDIDTEAIRRLRDHLLSPDAGSSRETGAYRPTADSIIRRVEPFAETMYLVIAADGVIAESELTALTSAIEILSDGNIHRPDLEQMLHRFQNRSDHPESRLAGIGARIGGDRDDRETAFTLAAVVALADDRVEPRENKILEWAREYFGISTRRMQALLENLGNL